MRTLVKKCPRCHVEDVLEGYDGDCWNCVHASQETEAALAAAVVEAAMAWNQGVEPMGDPEISAECAQRLADDLDSACAALQAFREGRAPK